MSGATALDGNEPFPDALAKSEPPYRTAWACIQLGAPPRVMGIRVAQSVARAVVPGQTREPADSKTRMGRQSARGVAERAYGEGEPPFPRALPSNGLPLSRGNRTGKTSKQRRSRRG